MYSPVGHTGSNTMTKGKKNKNQNNQKRKTQQRTIVRYEPAPAPSIGAMIGDGLQKLGTSLFTKWMGSGDYTTNDGSYSVKTNALIKGSQAKAVKMMSGGSDFVFTHSEYIGDVITSSTPGAFNQQSFRVNPIDPLTFPWLSNIASNFETYEILGLLFRFVSTSGESVAATNTSIGTVMGTFAYDPQDAPFVSKQQLLQYDDTVSCRFSNNFVCGVECDKSRLITFSNKLYVGNAPPGTDSKFYDFGNFIIATQGGQAASTNIGELHVSYVVKFHVTKDANYIPQQLYFRAQQTSVIAWSSIIKSAGTIPYTLNTTTGFMTLKSLNIGSLYTISCMGWSATATSWAGTAPFLSGGQGTSLYYFNGAPSYYFNSNFAGTSQSNTVNYAFIATSDTATLQSPILSTAASTYTVTISMVDSSTTY